MNFIKPAHCITTYFSCCNEAMRTKLSSLMESNSQEGKTYTKIKIGKVIENAWV